MDPGLELHAAVLIGLPLAVGALSAVLLHHRDRLEAVSS
jgi:hypothetical protein